MPGPFLENRYFVALLIFWCLLGIWLCGGAHVVLGTTETLMVSSAFPSSVVFFVLTGLGMIGLHLIVRRNARARARFFARLPGLVFRIDKDGLIEFASEQGLDWIGANLATDSRPDLRDHILDHASLLNLRENAISAQGDITVAELPLTTKEHEQRWLRVQMRALPPYTSDCQIDCIVWDITELVRERNLRRESQTRLETMANLSNEALFLHDSGKCVDANSAEERMFGYGRNALLNLSAADIISPETLPTVTDNIQSGYDKPYEAMAKRHDGSQFPCEINGRNVLIDGKTLRLTSFRDITERRTAEEQIRFQANHDALTSLPNRYLFMDRLTFAIKLSKRRRECFALMYIDLDGFKTLNDTRGHIIGDKVLRDVAARLSAKLRDVDTVARIGGDEFTVILSGSETPEDAEIVANKLKDALTSSPVELGPDEAPYLVTASIGISLYPDHAETIDELISAADSAMYMAKKNGRNTFRFATTKRSENS